MKIEIKATCNGMEFHLVIPEADLHNVEKYFPIIKRGCDDLLNK